MMTVSKEAILGITVLVFVVCGCAGPPARHSALPDPAPAANPPNTSPIVDPQVRRAAAQVPELPPAPTQSDSKAQSAPPLPDDPAARIRELLRRAEDRYASFDSYIARVHRREQVGGKTKPEEVFLFRYRKQPVSVYFKWIGNEGQGREVVYVQGRFGNKIHTLLAAGDMPFTPAGKRLDLAPDSIFVKNASRHSITDAGFGHVLVQLHKLLDAIDHGDPKAGTMKYVGAVKRPEFPQPLEVIERLIPPRADQDLADGGRRQVMFDPLTRLPLIVTTVDLSGRELEYYCYDLLQFPVRLDDDDFDPDKLWRTK